MAKPETRGHEQEDRKQQDEDDHCILCEAIIEVSDHEVFFATGYCRYCNEVVDEE